MEKIDTIDRKILYQLDLNSRQSFASIGKKIKVSKDKVAYRVNRLIEKGVIKNFYTVIDAFKLGYISFRFYLFYRNTDKKMEDEIIDYFVKNKFTWWVGSVKNDYNLGVIIWVKDIDDFFCFWNATLAKYRYYFEKQVFSVYYQLLAYRHSYLLEKYDETDRINYEIIGGGKKEKIDTLDIQLLRLIASNSRILTTEIAQKLDLTAVTVKNRIKKLVDLGVIQGFRVEIDYLKLGYQYFKVDIELKDHKKRKHIIDYVKSNPNLIIIDETAGYVDLELEFHLENLNQLLQIINDIKDKFPNTIQNYKHFYVIEIYKMNYIPEE